MRGRGYADSAPPSPVPRPPPCRVQQVQPVRHVHRVQGVPAHPELHPLEGGRPRLRLRAGEDDGGDLRQRPHQVGRRAWGRAVAAPAPACAPPVPTLETQLSLELSRRGKLAAPVGPWVRGAESEGLGGGKAPRPQRGAVGVQGRAPPGCVTWVGLTLRLTLKSPGSLHLPAAA